ncbi:MAG: AGE family epimerase/isomerase [Alphaproteobacteria bacterium]
MSDARSGPLSCAAVNARAQAWLRDAALPLWAEAGVDPATGGFIEALTPDGAPVTGVPRRFRVQARQIYVYADAAIRYRDARARDLVLRAFEWTAETYWAADDGWVFSVDDAGAVIDGTRDAYEQAFGIFAAAWLLRAAPGCGAERWIDRTFAFLDQRLASPHGGYLESLPAKTPRRQNPHMHLLEACLACFDATGNADYLDRARAIYGLFQRHWFDPAHAMLGEYFTDDWQPAANQRFEPGHHMEWAWLLQRLSERTGLDAGEALALHATAERHGRAADGLLIEECAPDGTPLLATKRAWPQTEEIKGQLAIHERTGDGVYLDRAAAAVSRLLDRYLRANGTWQDRLDAEGRGMTPDAPASTFYHIALALNEFDRLCGAGPKDG